MANIHTPYEDSISIPPKNHSVCNPMDEAVAALRGISSGFKGVDKGFEALFTMCIDRMEQQPIYNNCDIWADALLYLVEYDPDSRRSVIVESIAKLLLSKAYGDNDELPQPPQHTHPAAIPEPYSKQTVQGPAKQSDCPESTEDAVHIMCKDSQVDSDSLPHSLRHSNNYNAIEHARYLAKFLKQVCWAAENNKFDDFTAWQGLELVLDLLQDKIDIGCGDYKFPTISYKNNAPCLVDRNNDW